MISFHLASYIPPFVLFFSSTLFVFWISHFPSHRHSGNLDRPSCQIANKKTIDGDRWDLIINLWTSLYHLSVFVFYINLCLFTIFTFVCYWFTISVFFFCLSDFYISLHNFLFSFCPCPFLLWLCLDFSPPLSSGVAGGGESLPSGPLVRPA